VAFLYLDARKPAPFHRFFFSYSRTELVYNYLALRSMNGGIRPCIVRGKYNRVQRIKLMLSIASFDGRISMELRHLATFRTLATTLNFTQTAALLGYVQSSVSAQIQELEAELR